MGSQIVHHVTFNIFGDSEFIPLLWSGSTLLRSAHNTTVFTKEEERFPYRSPWGLPPGLWVPWSLFRPHPFPLLLQIPRQDPANRWVLLNLTILTHAWLQPWVIHWRTVGPGTDTVCKDKQNPWNKKWGPVQCDRRERSYPFKNASMASFLALLSYPTRLHRTSSSLAPTHHHPGTWVPKMKRLFLKVV